MRITESQLRKIIKEQVTESSMHDINEGDKVRIIGNVANSGKIGTVMYLSPSGEFCCVEFKDGTGGYYSCADVEKVTHR